MSHILLIEDDLDTGEAIRAMLTTLGHAVSWVHNGREALVFVRDHPAPDLVLTDILMPEMDGLESIQHLRSRLTDVPIIAMSAQMNAPYLQAAAVYGARVTLAKPFSMDALRDAFRRALGQPT